MGSALTIEADNKGEWAKEKLFDIGKRHFILNKKCNKFNVGVTKQIMAPCTVALWDVCMLKIKANKTFVIFFYFE